MTSTRPRHLQDVEYREIGAPLFEEVFNLMKGEKIVALLGPSNGGKGLVVEKVRARMEASSIPESERPLIVSLNWRHPKPLTGRGILQEIATQLGLNSLPEEDWNEETKCQEKIVSLLRSASVLTEKRRFCFLIEGILNLPNRYARDLLDALVAASQFAGGPRFGIAACITGSADFTPLCFGMNSPLRDQKKYLVVRMDKEYAREFFKERQRSDWKITDEGFDYLFEQTRGSPFLIREFAEALAEERRREKEANDVPWSGEQVRRGLLRLTEDHLASTLILRATAHGIASDRNMFNVALRLLQAPDNEGNTLEDLGQEIEGKSDPEATFLQLEVFEFVTHSEDGTRLVLSSPVMASVVRRMFDPGFVADGLAAQGRWEEAWKAFKQMDADLLERPVTGPARYRQRDLIPYWSDHLLVHAAKGPKSVLKEFVYGANYILGFPIAGLAVEEDGKVFWETALDDLPPVVPFKPEADDLDDFFLDQSGRTYRVLFNHGFRNRIVCSDLKFEHPVHRKKNAFLVLERPMESAVSHAEYGKLAHALDAFLNAYDLALRQEYDRTEGKIRERHLEVVKQIHRSLFVDPVSMENVAREAIAALVDVGKYRRVQVSFVNEQCTRIEDVPNEICPFPARSIYDLDHPEKDVLPWVVFHRKAAFIEDAKIDPRCQPGWKESDLTWNHEMAQSIDPPMEAISVVPMVLGRIKNVDDPIIGAIHFEREDGKLPPGYERELMYALARQIAAIFHLTRRLIPRERERMATQTLGEFTHMLGRSISIALDKISEALEDLDRREEQVGNLLRDGHQRIRGAMAYIQAVDPVAPNPAPQKRELSVPDLIRRAEQHATTRRETLSVLVISNKDCHNCTIQVDPDWFMRVVEILADNAIIHNEGAGSHAKKRRFTIEARRLESEPSNIQVLFWNEGKSIPREHRAKVFTRGFTTHPSGSGVGLTTARRIVEAHGGTLTVGDPGEEGGALFIITLPL